MKSVYANFLHLQKFKNLYCIQEDSLSIAILHCCLCQYGRTRSQSYPFVAYILVIPPVILLQNTAALELKLAFFCKDLFWGKMLFFISRYLLQSLSFFMFLADFCFVVELNCISCLFQNPLFTTSHPWCLHSACW